MAEATLSLSYNDLQAELARFVGYNPTGMTAAQIAELDRYIQSGVRQFYYPPAVEGVEAGYEWSFLKPVTSITTTADDGVQDLPDDFGRLIGDFHYSSTYSQSIVEISEHRITELLAGDSSSGLMKYAAIRQKAAPVTAIGQRQEVVWFPIPKAAYSLTYRYEAYQGKINSTTKPYPLGGMKHSETILESCLAVAEQRANDEKGIHWDAFSRLLLMSVAQDKARGARYFGAMSNGELNEPVVGRNILGTNYPITYKGETW
jgi:hypothetical protein